MYLMVLMVHNWFKAILNQLCTIGTNKYIYHKWKNHTAIDNPPVKRKKFWSCVTKTISNGTDGVYQKPFSNGTDGT